MSEATLGLEQLNQAQESAVIADLGNLLVLAGAGSGKTRVLVSRIAWMIRLKAISPYSIFAVTFTNKAAKEMRFRLQKLLGSDIKGAWIGTFHGLSHRILRLHWKEAGLEEGFQIIDSDDQLKIIKKLLKKLSVNDERWEPKKVQNFINRKKDEGKRYHQALQEGQGNQYLAVMLDLYQEYESYLYQNKVIDFSEMLIRVYELFGKYPDIKEYYQNRFQHFLVDEFQDTNSMQYLWLQQLSEQSASVMVVGDDDQSIYGWRGAKIENIQKFKTDYSGVRTIFLEQNYRSTMNILSAANALIGNNQERMGKNLWTSGDSGEKINVYSGLNEEDEALFVTRQIKKHLQSGGLLKDVAILYRSNAQSRVLEDALFRGNIPYVVYGGLRFFERAEVKDVLAYLKVAVNFKDNASVERSINVPPRGVGQKTVEKIRAIAEEQDESLWETIEKIIAEKSISGKAYAGIKDFFDVITTLKEEIKLQKTVGSIVETTINRSGLLEYFQRQLGEKAHSKAENLKELVSATTDFPRWNDEYIEIKDNSIVEFLSYTALEAGDNQAQMSQEQGETDSVQLMTLHAAKGLEYPTVFICGVEEGLFPNLYMADTDQKLEEERRLCYVGITRAMKKLYFTYAQRRRVFGKEESRKISRFITEVPQDLLEDITPKLQVSRATNFQIPISPGYEYKKTEKSPQKAGDSGFFLGQQVKHQKFGVGVIVDFEGFGEKSRICVDFARQGSKWLVPIYANLEAVT